MATGLVTQAELAKLLGVTRQLIHRFDRQGMGRDGLDGKRPLYRPDRCTAWYQSNVTNYGHGGDRPGSGARKRVRKKTGPELFDLSPGATLPAATSASTSAATSAATSATPETGAAGPAGEPDAAAAERSALDEKQRSASASLTELKGEHEQLRVIERRAQLRRQMGELCERAETLRLHVRAHSNLRDVVEREAKRCQDDLAGVLRLDQAAFTLLERRMREMVGTIRERMATQPFGPAGEAVPPGALSGAAGVGIAS
jgi:hypothetical protein